MESGRTEGYDRPIEAPMKRADFDATDIDTDLHKRVADAIQDRFIRRFDLALRRFDMQKSATSKETDEWRRQLRLGLHHACIKHIVDSINNFCEQDVHVQCADGQVKAGYPYLSRCTPFLPGISWFINRYAADYQILCDCNFNEA